MSDDINKKEVRDILIVDDEAELLTMIRELLEPRGYKVATAQNADEAMRQLDRFKVPLLILDVNLAGEDGVRLMTVLKANHPECKVMLYTGMSHEEEQIQKMLKAGATCYVNKSQPPADLFFAIGQILSGPPQSRA